VGLIAHLRWGMQPSQFTRDVVGLGDEQEK
jgi:hypothetical protein